MIIGIDIDNTITNTTETILGYAKTFGEQNNLNITLNSQEYFIEGSLGWDKKTADEFLKYHLTDIYNSVCPKPDSIDVIKHLHKNHSIVLITSRNEKFPLIRETTHEWLKKHQIKFDKLVMNNTDDMHHFSKLYACLENRIELMIEDHHDLAVELCEKIPVLMFDYPYNAHVKEKNIIRVKKWLEVREFIKKF
jgi:hypothetical protein